MAAVKGIWRAVVWDQGEADADGATATADYVARFRDVLLPALRERGGNPDMPVFIAPPGNYPDPVLPNTSVTSQAQFDRQREFMRQVFQTIVDTVPGVFFASFKLGGVHADDDPYHYKNATYDEVFGVRDGLTVAKAIGASTYDGRGPLVTGAMRSGATITLAIDRNGADTVAGPVSYNTYNGTRVAAPTNSFKGYEVSADNFATNLPINGIAISDGNLVITLASAPSGPVKVRSFAGASYDDTSLFVGRYDGGLTIPVAPIIKYLTA